MLTIIVVAVFVLYLIERYIPLGAKLKEFVLAVISVVAIVWVLLVLAHGGRVFG